MGVDEPGQQRDLAQVGDGLAGEVAAHVRPRPAAAMNSSRTATAPSSTGGPSMVTRWRAR